MFLFICVLTLIIFVIYTIFNRKNSCNNIYLLIYYILLFLYAATHYFIEVQPEPQVATLLFLHPAPLYMLLGPIIFFYVNSNLKETNALKNKWNYLHFIPALIHFIAIRNYYFLPLEVKSEIINALLQDPYKYFQLQVPGVKYHGQLGYLSRPIFIGIYCAISIYQLINFKLSEHFVIKKETNCGIFNYKFLWVFVLINLIYALGHSYIIIYQLDSLSQTSQFPYITSYIILGGLGLVAVSLLFFPNVLYGFIPRSSKHDLLRKKSKDFDDAIQQKLHENADRVITFMEEEKPYLNPNFSKTDLSLKLQLTNQELSDVFDFVIHEKFTDYKNRLRVSYAKKMIEDGNSSLMSMEGIGKSAGFAYRSTFYSLFKKETGLTPVEYFEKLNKNK